MTDFHRKTLIWKIGYCVLFKESHLDRRVVAFLRKARYDHDRAAVNDSAKTSTSSPAVRPVDSLFSSAFALSKIDRYRAKATPDLYSRTRPADSGFAFDHVDLASQ